MVHGQRSSHYGRTRQSQGDGCYQGKVGVDAHGQKDHHSGQCAAQDGRGLLSHTASRNCRDIDAIHHDVDHQCEPNL
eukprot:Skav228611  [mRNA]  locus=scaffold5568:19582:23929:- [translate_table: standard]